MDGPTAATVAATLQALATPSRLQILTTLRQRPHPVSALAAAIGMSPSTASHQLRLLRALGLVTGERAGA
ncbi:ArsR/SmtB family transcription factor [Streptomyces sp. NPDC058000]|uniref:ArsR/SmtB family transcription factor n=1 Tax=Streptomyces sp. NPDC058000 TaxID=3346299 RepID=UPI0036E7816F